MATFPTLKVEIAFASDPLDDTPTWTDVSAYVRQVNGVDVRRGRVDPLSPFPAGKCSLTLSNRDRRFDSTYSSGPYFGNLKPRKQIRLSATWASVDYEVFTGFVGEWPQSFTNKGKDATVEINCYDALDWAAGTRLSDDLVFSYLESIGTVPPCYREVDASSWSDASGFGTATVLGSLTVGPSMVPGSSSGAVSFSGSSRVLTSGTGGTPDGCAFVVRVDELQASADSMTVLSYSTPGTGGNSVYHAKVQTNGTVVFSWLFNNGLFNVGSVTSARSIADGLPHLVAIVFISSTRIDLYIDGTFDATSSNSVGSSVGFGFRSIGAMETASSSIDLTFTPCVGLTVQDVLNLPSPQSSTTIATLYALLMGEALEGSATRVTRYLDDAGWPAAWRDITTKSKATVSTISYDGRQLIGALQEVERSEQGRVFVSKSGDLTFHGRYHYAEETRGNTSQATFSDDGAAFGYASFGLTESDENVLNDVTVTNSAARARSTSSASITTYGRRSETVNTILSSLTQVQDMAGGIVSQRKNQSLRIDAFTVVPPADWADLLGLELGDRITVEITPMQTGSQLVQELLLDSIEWNISDQGWWLTLGASPVPPDVFVLDSSLLDGTDVLGF